MDHSAEEERDCGNKPGEANLTAVNRGPLVHQPFSANDGGGELQHQHLIKLFRNNKAGPESKVDQLRGVGRITRLCFVTLQDSFSFCGVNEDSAQ